MWMVWWANMCGLRLSSYPVHLTINFSPHKDRFHYAEYHFLFPRIQTEYHSTLSSFSSSFVCKLNIYLSEEKNENKFLVVWICHFVSSIHLFIFYLFTTLTELCYVKNVLCVPTMMRDIADISYPCPEYCDNGGGNGDELKIWTIFPSRSHNVTFFLQL